MEDREAEFIERADSGTANSDVDHHRSSSIAPFKEKHLQKLIMASPTLLPGIDDGLVARAAEVSIPREGPADVVVVDRDGAITLVECKRAVNPEARRWVIGQLLGYAAWLWKLDYEGFKQRFNKTGSDLTKPFKGVPGWEETRFSEAVTKNLTDGRFRLVVAADEINDWLKRTVVLLNSHTLPEIECLAVSIDPAARQVTGVFGRESSEAWPYRPSWKPARKKILDGIEDEDAVRAAAGLLRWAADQPLVRIDFKPTTSRGVIKTTAGRTLFRIEGYEHVRASFHALGDDEERMEQLRADLAAIDLRFEGGPRPKAPLGSLVYEDKRESFLALMEEILRTAPPS